MFKPKGRRWEMRQRSKYETYVGLRSYSVFPAFQVLCFANPIYSNSFARLLPPYHQGILC